MKSSEDYFVKKNLRQSIANARGRYSTQFTSGELNVENLSMKKKLEEGIKMGGYELNIRKPVMSRSVANMHKPIAGSSEFWLG